jgi:hypothetical protein
MTTGFESERICRKALYSQSAKPDHATDSCTHMTIDMQHGMSPLAVGRDCIDILSNVRPYDWVGKPSG